MKKPEPVDPELKKAVDPYLEKFFFKRMITSYETRRGYKYQIYKFFRLLDTTPEEYLQNMDLEKTEDHLLKIYHDMKENGAAPYTIKGFFNPVKQFLFIFDKKYKSLDFWETFAIRMKSAESISEQLVPNKNDLKKILQHGDTVSRAIFLIQSCTGMRLGEVCGFKIRDVKTNENPVRIRINRSFDPSKPDKTKQFTKTNMKRNCFLTDEATEAYYAWLKERDAWLESAVKIARPYNKLLNDERVFPMNPENARKKWRTLVRRAGYDKKDDVSGIRLVHPHCLRKYFRSYLGNADLAEHIMGHAQGMTRQYRNMKLEDLQEEFLKYADNITIFESTFDLTEVNESLKEKEDRIKELEETMHIMKMKMDIMENKLELEKIKNGKKK